MLRSAGENLLKNVHLTEASRSGFVLTHKERNDLEGPWGENALGTTLEPQLVCRGDFHFRGRKATLVVGGLLVGGGSGGEGG